jgi:hypothetical protein
MVKSGCVWMWFSDCHKYNDRRWKGSFIPLQRTITVQSAYAVHNSSPAGASCILPAVSLDRHQTHIYIPPWRELYGYASPTTSELSLLHSKEIRSYLYTRVQSRVQLIWILFILIDLINKEIQIIKSEWPNLSISRVSSVHHSLFYV